MVVLNIHLVLLLFKSRGKKIMFFTVVSFYVSSGVYKSLGGQ